MKSLTVILTLLLAYAEVSNCYTIDSTIADISSPRWLHRNKENKNQIANDLQHVELEGVPSLAKEGSDSSTNYYQQSECQMVQVVHLLHQHGCQPKAIASFACSGSCSSYVQVSFE